MVNVQSRPALGGAQVVLLRPVEIGLFPHFRPALARGNGQRADVDAVGLGALQQRHVPQLRGGGKQRPHQVAQHAVVGADLLIVAPALDQSGQFEQSRVDQVSDIAQRVRRLPTGSGVCQVKRKMPSDYASRAAAGNGDDIDIGRLSEMLQRRVANEARRASHQHRLATHRHDYPSAPVANITGCDSHVSDLYQLRRHSVISSVSGRPVRKRFAGWAASL